MSLWDDMYRSGEFRKHWDYSFPSQELVATVAMLNLPRGSVALDVGCGAGREAIFLSRCGFKVFGVDISEEALKIARERATEARVLVEWRKGDALELPIDDGSVDFINDRGCFHHVRDTDRSHYAAEMARVMKHGARLLIRGCREASDERFVLVTAEAMDRFFGVQDFARGPVLPIELVSDSTGGLVANLVVLTRR